MTADTAFNKIVEYAADTVQGPHISHAAIRADIRRLTQDLLDETALEIGQAWGKDISRAEGLAFALGFLHTRYRRTGS